MTEREKLKKQINKVHGDQVMDGETKQTVEDLYPIDSDILTYALDYIPVKILKKIIKANQFEIDADGTETKKDSIL